MLLRYRNRISYDDNETIVLNFRDDEKKVKFNWDLGFVYVALAKYLEFHISVFNTDKALFQSYLEEIKKYVAEIQKQLDNAEGLDDLEAVTQKFNEMMSL